MNMPAVGVSLRMPPDLWEKVNALVESDDCRDFSHALRSLLEGGLWLQEHKDDIHDPELVQNFIKEWNSNMNEKKIFDWTKQLSDDQIRSVRMALDLEREGRYKS